MLFSFDTPPIDAIAYLREKKPELHFDYDEMLHEAHHKAFTVAKVVKLDLLSDIQESLIQAQQKGKSFASWKKDLTPTLIAKGWYGKTEVFNEDTGEFKTINVNSRRLQTIYDTNMRTSYAQGRYKSQMMSSFEYLRYSSILDSRTRPAHASKHGIILPKTHPWWDTNYPPNGWRCRCSTSAISQSMMDDRGLKVTQVAPANVADKDWAYHVGKTDTTMKAYEDKLKALKANCDDGKNARQTRPCMERLYDEAQKEFIAYQKTLAERTATFIAIKELFTTTEKKSVELCKSSIFGEEKRVLLSSDTVGTHGHHPEIGAFEYSLVPYMLEGRAFKAKDNLYIIVKKLGSYYRVALKNVKNTDEIYVSSLVGSSNNKEMIKWIKSLSTYEEVMPK